MNHETIIRLAEQCGATHKQSLGVYQFFPSELEIFVEKIRKDLQEEIDRLNNKISVLERVYKALEQTEGWNG